MNEIQFDSEKAGRLRSQALDTFRAKGRTVARVTYASLLICLVFACLLMRLFFVATDVQSWILYASLFLVMLETTVLMKLWYWVINSKLGILREVKLLRMDLAIQKGSMDTLEELARIESPARTRDLPKWERAVWLAALMTFGMTTGLVIGFHGSYHHWIGNPLLNLGADVKVEQTESQTFSFKPTGNQLRVNLRADTTQGTISFDIYAPDGHVIAEWIGGRMTVSNAGVQVKGAGEYTLKVTPHQASGHWRACIDDRRL